MSVVLINSYGFGGGGGSPADTGWVGFSAFASVTGIGTVNWITPISAQFSDNGRASVSLGINAISRWLRCTNLVGDPVPGDAEITGFGIQREGHAVTPGDMQDWALRLVIGNVIKSTQPALFPRPWASSDDLVVYGGVEDLMGESSVTPVQANGATFGLAFSAKSASLFNIARIDQFMMKVHYLI